MITGYYVRIERDGRWVNAEINALTDQELESFAEQQGIDRGWAWAIALAKWIRDHIVDDEPDDG